MATGRWRYAILALATASLTAAAPRPADNWVPVWGSAQMLASGADADALAAAGPVTIRQIVHVSTGGRGVRVRLSNAFGDAPLRIAAATIATNARPGQPDVAGIVPLTFGGATAVTIPAGGEYESDPLALTIATGQNLAISLHFPDPVARHTTHPGARATTYWAPGDQTAAAALATPHRIGGWWSLAEIDIARGPAATVVAIGDSITDGKAIRDDSNTRWPDVFARRLATDPATRGLGVVNAGIGGNRVLLDGLGPSLVARFDRDVVARPNVRHAILLEGVNDLGTLTREAPADAATHRALVADIIRAYREVAARAHAHGITIMAGTITPLVGNDYYHAGAATEADRQALNAFLRTAPIFDSVVDFDRAIRDPAHPDRLLAAYDSGDHLHPNEAGYRAMADAIPLAPFKAKGERARR